MSSSVRGRNGPIAPTQPRFLFLLPSEQRGGETADGIFAKSTEITKLKKNLSCFFDTQMPYKNQKHPKEERTTNMSPIFKLLLVCQILDDILSLRERKGGREDNVLLSPSPLFFVWFSVFWIRAIHSYDDNNNGCDKNLAPTRKKLEREGKYSKCTQAKKSYQPKNAQHNKNQAPKTS